jgi:hypothetical protein
MCLEGKSVQLVREIYPDTFLVVVEKDIVLKVVDRAQNLIVGSISVPSNNANF